MKSSHLNPTHEEGPAAAPTSPSSGGGWGRGCYFTIAELTRSDTATKHGWDNTPPPEAVQNLRSLAEYVLDPLREAYGHPIHVNSGYRSATLNSAVGGTARSQHLRGQAADIRGEAPLPSPQKGEAPDSQKREVEKLGQLLIDLDLPFDQLIFYPTFLHVSWSNSPRRQVLHKNS